MYVPLHHRIRFRVHIVVQAVLQHMPLHATLQAQYASGWWPRLTQMAAILFIVTSGVSAIHTKCLNVSARADLSVPYHWLNGRLRQHDA